jgi:hypothetical protein
MFKYTLVIFSLLLLANTQAVFSEENDPKKDPTSLSPDRVPDYSTDPSSNGQPIQKESTSVDGASSANNKVESDSKASNSANINPNPNPNPMLLFLDQNRRKMDLLKVQIISN